MTNARRPRRDAIANRERLIDAAFVLLGSRDADISVSELAAASGVGVGTAYRHFPNHEALVRALYDRAVDEFASRIESVAVAGSAWDQLAKFVEEGTLIVADTPGVRAVMRLMYDLDPEYAPARRAVAPFDQLISAAKAEGALRDDITAADLTLTVFSLGSFVGRPVGPEREALSRISRLVVDGMRADGAKSDLPPAQMDQPAFHAFMHRSNAAPPQVD